MHNLDSVSALKRKDDTVVAFLHDWRWQGLLFLVPEGLKTFFIVSQYDRGVDNHVVQHAL